MSLFHELLQDVHTDEMRIPGITTGIVKENYDQEHPGMVKVELFLGEQGKNLTGWIPVMTNYAGEKYGNYWLPEIGQEVVVAFIYGEKNCPVVLGALWDKKNILPEGAATEKNTVKMITTKNGIKIQFSEEEKKTKIDLETPGKLAVHIDDEAQTISIVDEKAENQIQINCKDGNITLDAKTRLELSIGHTPVVSMDKDTLTLDAKTINIKGKQKVEVSGQNVKVSAQSNAEISANANASMKGNAGLKLESSALTEVKGSMLKLN